MTRRAHVWAGPGLSGPDIHSIINPHEGEAARTRGGKKGLNGTMSPLKNLHTALANAMCKFSA